uniref:Proteasome activator PA28 C-terminal domain-containing protein n=1 Tax=Glossina austeni TaxID=7395 RepID=A0A1A9VTR7_GLOAU
MVSNIDVKFSQRRLSAPKTQCNRGAWEENSYFEFSLYWLNVKESFWEGRLELERGTILKTKNSRGTDEKLSPITRIIKKKVKALTMSSDNIAKLEDYKDSLIKKAEQLITQGFPEKIIQLNELLASPMFHERKLSDFHQHLNIPVPGRVLVNKEDSAGDCEQPAKRARTEPTLDSGVNVTYLPIGSVACNASLSEIINTIKPMLYKLIEESDILKMWISFMIPKIEAGNNFGVSIQEDILDETERVKAEAVVSFDQISNYFVSRARIVAKVVKYPHIDDYRNAVVELDEKQYLDLWMIISNVRNRYLSLLDVVTKNMEKLKTPRSSNADLY